MTSIANRTVTPRSCTLLFGIPIERSAFDADRADGRGKDFVRRHPDWDQYWRQVARPAQQLARHAADLGARVVANATLRDYAEALQSHVDVVILISHWIGDRVELWDGLHPVDTLVRGIPPEFDGVLDLCVCTPSRLALSVREQRGSTLVRYAPVLAWPPLWFGYFEALLTRLTEQPVTYAAATSEVSILFMTAETVPGDHPRDGALPPVRLILFGDPP